MRKVLYLCGAGVLVAALVWIPIRSRSHELSASTNAMTDAGQVIAKNSGAAERPEAAADKGPFLEW